MKANIPSRIFIFLTPELQAGVRVGESPSLARGATARRSVPRCQHAEFPAGARVDAEA